MINIIKDRGWLFNRLRAMSFNEIKYRIQLEINKRIWKTFRIEHKPRSISFQSKEGEINDYNFMNEDIDSVEKESLLKEAENYISGKWMFFNLDNIHEDEINWHLDPETGNEAPIKFSFDINHRNEQTVGKIKNIWEKNRHHHLSVLSIAYKITGNECFAAEVKKQIKSWIKQNPYLYGVNWTHPLEHAIRLISWVWCERLLRKSISYNDIFGKESPIWRSIYQHQKFISKTYSVGSSANNHLIGEMAGLFIAATAWPYFPESKKWQKFSKDKLEEEINSQTHNSGINKEQAFSYQIFVIEFFLMAALEAKNNENLFSTNYYDLLRKMIEVIPLMTDYERNLPRYGDDDEGMAIQLRSMTTRRDNWIYEIGNSLLGADVPVTKNNTLPGLILGENHKCERGKRIINKTIGFRDAGIFILSENRYMDDEVFVMADAGPLGYLSIAAHGHADALSFTMSVGGVPIIVDPGTYCYHTEKEWRYYFRGTKAHNTITIDGEDQSIQKGPFLWSHKANTVVNNWKPDQNILSATHDGYKRFDVMHNRLFNLENNTLLLRDKLSGKGLHQIENRLHFAPQSKVDLNDQYCTVDTKGKKIKIRIDDQLSSILLNGNEEGGWYSGGFGKKIPSFTLVMRKTIELPFGIKTIINIQN